MKLCLDL